MKIYFLYYNFVNYATRHALVRIYWLPTYSNFYILFYLILVFIIFEQNTVNAFHVNIK